jgi:hypothetical protein
MDQQRQRQDLQEKLATFQKLASEYKDGVTSENLGRSPPR